MTLVHAIAGIAAVALLLYVLFGGADYGAGILELFKGRRLHAEQEATITRAMGPVWEANHIWLILLVVILFMGFPRLYSLISIHLHLPLVAVLVGIVIRGCAFTFRHYDPVTDLQARRVYSALFAGSSLWTSVWLGITAASLSRGNIDPQAATYFDSYVAPWWGLFPLSVGVFVACLFAFLAAVYLIGEARDFEVRALFSKRAQGALFATVLSGGWIFVAADVEGLDLPEQFFSHPVSIAAFCAATGLHWPLWSALTSRKPAAGIWARVWAGAQIACVLIGWYALNGLDVVVLKGGALSFAETAAPAATLRQLLLALCVGLALILPALIFLLRVFKISLPENKPQSSS